MSEEQRDLFGAGAMWTSFEAYHAANPQVYQKLLEFALAAKRAGRKRFGIGVLYERVRWYTHVEAESDPDWKLNNNHRAYYARLLMQQEPELRGFFELRVSRADDEGI